MAPLLRSSRLGLVVILVIGLTGLAVAGCEELGGGGTTDTSLTDPSVTDDSIPTGTTDTTAVTGTTAGPSGSPTPTTLASTEEVLPNGNIRSMGYIDDVFVSGGVRYLSIDYCEFVYGAEATAAARADGVIGPTEEWDLDFYIRNQNPRLREWSVSTSVVITTSTRLPPHDGIEVPCTWSDFLSFWSGSPLPDDAHMSGSPWWIERDGDTIVKIDEQYLP